MRLWKLLGLAIVAVGIVYLLGELRVIPDVSRYVSFGVLWPLVFTGYGLIGLRRRGGWRFSAWSIFFFVLGIVWVLKNMHVLPLLDSLSMSGLLTALIIISIGLGMLLPRHWRIPTLQVRIDSARNIRIGADDIPLSRPRRSTARGGGRQRPQAARTIFGDLSYGKEPWLLSDLDVFNVFGDVRVNVATAQLEPGDHRIDITNVFGEVRILLPESIAVSVEAQVAVGDVAVFGDRSDGISRALRFEDPRFATAPTRLLIDANVTFGDIEISRV